MSELGKSLGADSLQDSLETATEFAPRVPDKQENDEDSFLSLTGDVIGEDWLIANAYEYLTRPGSSFNSTIDPDWNLTADHLKGALDEGVSLENLEYIRDAESEVDFQALKKEVLHEQDVDRRVGEQGAGGIAMRLGVNILDPVGIAAAVFSGGLLGASTKAKPITNLGKLFKSAALGTAEGVAVEAGASLDKATWNNSDVFAGMLGASVLNTGINRVSMGAFGRGGSPKGRAFSAQQNYTQRRYEFIAEEHEGWKDTVYADSLGNRTVGYGFNLDEPANRELYKSTLGRTDEDFDSLRDGSVSLTESEGRSLFDASVKKAEDLIDSKFPDVDLKGHERLALVSLAYNHPNLIGPDLIKHVKAGDTDKVVEEILTKSNRNKIEGIDNRRSKEAEMYSGGDKDVDLSSLYKADEATTEPPIETIKRDHLEVLQKEKAIDEAESSGNTQLAQELRASLQPSRSDVADANGYVTIAGRKIPLRFDMMFRVLNSKSKIVQERFSNLAQNVMGDTRGGKIVAMSATEGARVYRQSLGKIFNNISAQDTIFHADIPKGGDRGSRAAVFAQLVEQAVVRGDDYIDDLTYQIKKTDWRGNIISVQTHKATDVQKEALKKSRDKYRKLMDHIRKEAEKYGVDGFRTKDADGNFVEGAAYNPNYVHRRINPTTIKTWLDEIRKTGVENPEAVLVDIIAQAYKSGARQGEEITDAVAKAAAKTYLLGIKRAADGDFMRGGVISKANIDELETFLRNQSVDRIDGTKQLAGEEEEIIAQMKAILTKTASGGPADATKRRFQIDETYVHTLGDLKINVEDLFDRNAYAGLDSYIRQMTGRISAAKHLGIKSDKDFDNIIKEIQDEAKATGNKDSVDIDIRNVTTMYSHLVGKPIDKFLGGDSTRGSKTHQNLKFAHRLLLDYNYMRVMNQVGFAQIAEIYNVAALMGWKAMLANMPALKVMKRNLETGEIMEDDLMRDIESITGIGAEYSRYATVSERYSGTAEEVLGDTYSATQKKILDVSTKGKRVTSMISGMTPITTGTQRLAAKAAIHRMGQLTSKTLTEKDLMRFRDLGWRDEDTLKIMDQLKKGMDKDSGKLGSLRLEDWDPDLRETFANGLTRWTYRAIQENDIGATGYFMSQGFWKLLTQFRTFMLVSHAKQFLPAVYNGFTRGDLQGAHALMGTTFMGGLSYMAQTYVKNLGTGDDDDLSDFIDSPWDDDSKYSLKNVSTSAFQRSSYSSFIPMITDTIVNDLTGLGDPIFGTKGRSTGLGSDPLTGSPAYDTGVKIFRLLGEGRDAAWGEDFDPKKLRAFAFSNALGIHNAIEAASK